MPRVHVWLRPVVVGVLAALITVLSAHLAVASALVQDRPAAEPPSDDPAEMTQQPQISMTEADEAEPQPVEPDYRIVNLPTTLWLPVHGMNFGLTHRFAGNLRSGSFGHQLENLFGLDQGASIGLEFRYGIARRLQAVVFRTNLDKTIQFYGKWDAVHQDHTHPLSISALASIEGSNNFRVRREPAFGAVISRRLADRVALYATPLWVHATGAEAGLDRDTFVLGLAGRIRVGRSVFVVGEVTPRLSGYAPGDPEYGFGIEKRVGGHVFQLNLTNTFATTFAQIARGGYPDTLYLGFNLGRKFY